MSQAVSCRCIQVAANKLWATVGRRFNPPSTMTDLSFVFKRNFVQALSAFEQVRLLHSSRHFALPLLSLRALNWHTPFSMKLLPSFHHPSPFQIPRVFISTFSLLTNGPLLPPSNLSTNSRMRILACACMVRWRSTVCGQRLDVPSGPRPP